MLQAVGAGHEGTAGHPCVVAGARRLEVGQEGRIVDVAERVGVHEADLDRVLIAEKSADGCRPAAHVRRC